MFIKELPKTFIVTNIILILITNTFSVQLYFKCVLIV